MKTAFCPHCGIVQPLKCEVNKKVDSKDYKIKRYVCAVCGTHSGTFYGTSQFDNIQVYYAKKEGAGTYTTDDLLDEIEFEYYLRRRHVDKL